jgi:DNA polymerase-3 subunit delta
MVQLLCGENVFAVEHALHVYVADFLRVHDSFGLERVDGSAMEASQLDGVLLQVPFLSEKRLVIIRSPFAVKALQDRLVELLPALSDTADVLLVEPKPDKRTSLYKKLSASGQVVEFTTPKGKDLTHWLVAYAKERGSALNSKDAEYLIRRVGVHTQQLASEIDKLSIAGDVINQASIDALTDEALSETVFSMLDQVFTSGRARALSTLHALYKDSVEPQEIMGMLAWQLHVFLLVKFALIKGGDTAKETGLHPFVAGKARDIVSRMTLEQLRQALDCALRADEAIKTSPVHAGDAVELLIVELSTISS